MDPADFLARLRDHQIYKEQIVDERVLPARPAQFGEPATPLPEALRAALAARGIEQLYCHQAAALDHIRSGQHLTVVSGTASGKTLCYTLPILERLLADPLATALCLYPTKALAQDQLRGLQRFREAGIEFMAGCFDGDTPQNLRSKLRDGGQIILSNPDMLHAGILPRHGRWHRFFSTLRYVVIDELHAYRGIFGSHLANVLRRLRRICRHYGADPQFICCSATIANPREHAEAVTGCPMALVDEDGAPRGPRHVVMWNPPPIQTAVVGDAHNWRVGGERRSALMEASRLLALLVRENVQSIAFVRTRLAAELVFKTCRDELRPYSRRLSEAIQAYRGGYLPEERREIERRLAEREILGVASTNALELGIDIGSLDACLLVGYPGAVASFWQQAGRAGRGSLPSLVFLLGQNAPVDQFLMQDPEYLFAQSPEQAVIDADNPHVVVGHLKCAVQELPLPPDRVGEFGEYADIVLELLAEDNLARQVEGSWYWADHSSPSREVNLRNVAGPVFTIQDEAGPERIIGTLDEVSALSQLHDHAVYLHAAETYFVNKLDLEQKIAHVERRDLDYYTQSVQTAQIQLDQAEIELDWQGQAGYGEVTVTTTIPMFKKIRFQTRESLGFEELELPPQLLETVAMWWAPPPAAVAELRQRFPDRAEAGPRSLLLGEALLGVANVLVEVAPLYVLCDVSDVGAVVDASCLGRDAIFVYDRYPGGVGFARRCLEARSELMGTVREVLTHCACADGCPSCVGAAMPAFAMGDLDSATRGRIPNKEAARFLLECLDLGVAP